MSARYEFWLLDDSGRRIALLNPFLEGGMVYFSYTRTVRNLGVIQIGFPYRPFREKFFPVFKPDWRIDVFRAPSDDLSLRREGTYLLRAYNIYTREDGVDMIRFYGRDGKDLLNRRYVVQAAGTDQTRKQAPIDDMMKAVVREQMLYNSALDPEGVLDNDRAYPGGEFFVQQDNSLGPSIPYTMADRKVLDLLNELSDASLHLYSQNPTSAPIYFDVVPYPLTGFAGYIEDETGEPILDEGGYPLVDESSFIIDAPLGFRFETWAWLRGVDRTSSSLVFSVENNNLKAPSYVENHLEEVNTDVIKGFGRGESRPYVVVSDTKAAIASRWNRVENYRDGSQEPDQTNLEELGYADLENAGAKYEFDATFLNVPGALYGIDWDLGDLLPVSYAEKQLNVEIRVVYVSMDENGKEEVTGRSNVNAGDSPE